MFWRFQNLTNNFRLPEFENLTDLTLTSLKNLIAQLPDGEINWKSLHHEMGEIGLGRWGHLCLQYFKPIKHTRQYKRWVLEKRRKEALNYRQQLKAGPRLTTSPESVLKTSSPVRDHHTTFSVCDHPPPVSTCDHPPPLSTCDHPPPLSTCDHPPPLSTCDHPPPLSTCDHPPPLSTCDHPPPLSTCDQPPPLSTCDHPPPLSVSEHQFSDADSETERLDVTFGISDSFFNDCEEDSDDTLDVSCSSETGRKFSEHGDKTLSSRWDGDHVDEQRNAADDAVIAVDTVDDVAHAVDVVDAVGRLKDVDAADYVTDDAVNTVHVVNTMHAVDTADVVDDAVDDASNTIDAANTEENGSKSRQNGYQCSDDSQVSDKHVVQNITLKVDERNNDKGEDSVHYVMMSVDDDVLVKDSKGEGNPVSTSRSLPAQCELLSEHDLDMTSSFLESIALLDAVIQDYDVKSDSSESQHSTLPTDDCLKLHELTYRNLRCSVSMETVLRELRKDREEEELSPASADSGTVSVMFEKDNYHDDTRPVKRKTNLKTDGKVTVSSSNGNESPMVPFPLHASFSCPTLMLSSTFITEPISRSYSTDQAAQPCDDVAALPDSEVVALGQCGDEGASDTSSDNDIVSDGGSNNDADDEDDQQEVEEQRPGSTRENAVSISSDSNVSVVASSVLSGSNVSVAGSSVWSDSKLSIVASSVWSAGHAMFSPNKSTTDSDLGLEVIDLTEGHPEPAARDHGQTSSETLPQLVHQSESYTSPPRGNQGARSSTKGSCQVS